MLAEQAWLSPATMNASMGVKVRARLGAGTHTEVPRAPGWRHRNPRSGANGLQPRNRLQAKRYGGVTRVERNAPLRSKGGSLA